MLGQKFLEGTLKFRSHVGDPVEIGHSSFDEAFVERENDEDLLDVHLDDGLADEGGTEEGPEGNEKVATSDAGKVEQRIGDLENNLSSYEATGQLQRVEQCPISTVMLLTLEIERNCTSDDKDIPAFVH